MVMVNADHLAGETWRFDIRYMGYAHEVVLDEVVAY